ncbi:unnamed protein product [Effrenium voratum]|uniref:IRG-type G domain-containing protein n=1 Tax=Effrenium voratum TaxID=2562239 RepID=A0AA36JH02_9DINO|nr:unnamed protein product [Effrenium voratum]
MAFRPLRLLTLCTLCTLLHWAFLAFTGLQSGSPRRQVRRLAAEDRENEGAELVAAAKVGDAELLAELLARGADCDGRDGDGQRPLTIAAAAAGHGELVEKLLAAKADVEAKNSNGATAVIAAAFAGDGETLPLLLAANAAPDAATASGATALAAAVEGVSQRLLNIHVGFLPAVPAFQCSDSQLSPCHFLVVMGNGGSKHADRAAAAASEAAAAARQALETVQQQMEAARNDANQHMQQYQERQGEIEKQLRDAQARHDQEAAESTRRLQQSQAAEAEARQRALDEQRLRAEEAATAAQRLVEEREASERRVQEELQQERRRVHAEKLARWQRLNRDYPVPAWLESYLTPTHQTVEEQEGTTVRTNVALLGDSGKGKTSLIKAVFKQLIGRNLDTQLTVSLQSDGTLAPTPINLPLRDAGEVTLWDLPGQGTKAIPSKTYLCNMGLKYFDVVVVVTDGRWSENDASLLQAIRFAEIHCMIARSKVDIAVDDGAHDHSWTPEQTLTNVQQRVAEATGMDESRIFLTTSRERFWEQGIGRVDGLCAQLRADLAAVPFGQSGSASTRSGSRAEPDPTDAQMEDADDPWDMVPGSDS